MLLAVCCLLFSCAKEEITSPEPIVQNTLRTGGNGDKESGADHNTNGAVYDDNGNKEIINPKPTVQNNWRTGDDDEEQGASNEIDGTVSDENGNAENNVEVQLDTQDGIYIATCFSNADGYYQFDNICHGLYFVRVRPNHGNEEVYSVRIE